MLCENLVASLPSCRLRVLLPFLCICVALDSQLLDAQAWSFGALWEGCGAAVSEAESWEQQSWWWGPGRLEEGSCQPQLSASARQCARARFPNFVASWHTQNDYLYGRLPGSLKAEGPGSGGGGGRSVFQRIHNSCLARWLEKLCPREEEYGILIKYFVKYLIRDGFTFQVERVPGLKPGEYNL